MPPALSDEEDNASSSGEEEIPFRGKEAPVEEDENDEDEEEFVVEKILGHDFSDDGLCLYQVKWLGYEKKGDLTWEPEDNLSGAIDVLNDYHDKIGGRPQFGETKPKKRGRKKSGVESEASTPAAAPNKRAKKEKDWKPPPGSWENDVEYVDTVEELPDEKTGKLVRYAYLTWNNQRKTQHTLEQVYHKCPQKMLQYYESHLVFTHPGADDTANGIDDVKDDDI